MSTPPDLSHLPSLSATVAKYDLAPRKSLGQNFLFDLNLTKKIARSAGDLSGCTVIEVGPGPGGLTRGLLECGARRIIALEKDSRAIAALAELSAAAPGILEVHEADALTVDESALCPPPIKIVANLPYNISTQLLFKWLEKASLFESFTLMFQKEVAGRITATPDCKAYGKLSVMTQWLCEAYPLFDIPPGAFTPAPKVTSTVVSIIPRKTPVAPADYRTLSTVCNAAFGQRRKMLRGSLKSLGVDTEALLTAAGIDGTRRAENLSITEFCALSTAYARLRPA
ncbi:MAG: 16S rRNA (adenine(1518)-N(6)/adenine(1519)-N(6))-dimethyltransferase RsmA [Alphaproteobacteria bacterium]|nr:16S rRNA (adenine(1518)-N(6)/adenine(1519)-N(6))-dimethyltransferase RsmA [Alphaproteobacteria bacterium]